MQISAKERRAARRKNKLKLSGWDIGFNIVNYTVLAIITLACVFPFYYLL